MGGWINKARQRNEYEKRQIVEAKNKNKKIPFLSLLLED